jgi:hypothetical protein
MGGKTNDFNPVVGVKNRLGETSRKKQKTDGVKIL